MVKYKPRMRMECHQRLTFGFSVFGLYIKEDEMNSE